MAYHCKGESIDMESAEAGGICNMKKNTLFHSKILNRFKVRALPFHGIVLVALGHVGSCSEKSSVVSLE